MPTPSRSFQGTKKPGCGVRGLSLFLGEFAPDLVALYGAFPAARQPAGFGPGGDG